MNSRYKRDRSGFIVFPRAGILRVISGVSEIMMPQVQYSVQVQGEAVGGGVNSGWAATASLLPGWTAGKGPPAAGN